MVSSSFRASRIPVVLNPLPGLVNREGGVAVFVGFGTLAAGRLLVSSVGGGILGVVELLDKFSLPGSDGLGNLQLQFHVLITPAIAHKIFHCQRKKEIRKAKEIIKYH